LLHTRCRDDARLHMKRTRAAFISRPVHIPAAYPNCVLFVLSPFPAHQHPGSST
jgi:hypothetical protein